LDRFTRIDILVTNPGGAPFVEENEELWQRSLAVDVMGTVLPSGNG